MNEAAFPLVGPLLVFLLVLPISAMVTRVLLVVFDWFDSTSGLLSGQAIRYAVLVASSAAPLLWFISASLHQAEHGLAAEVCAAAHAPGALCAEAAYFSLGLCVLAAAFGVPRLVRGQFAVRTSHTPAARFVRTRIEQILNHRSGLLAPLRRRIVVVDDSRAPIETVGIVFPRVVVRTAFAELLDDEALVAALHHEFEHCCRQDPLRYFVASWALAVNPIGGWLLRPEHARWILAREAQCDRQAVLAGAFPLALAQALLLAARPKHQPSLAGLGSGQVEAVKLRIGLLLAYADQAPRPCNPSRGRWLLVLVLAVVLAHPHGAGTEPLDRLHQVSESAVSFLMGS